MDTSGFSQVGRYGTLSLMKRQEPNTVVTAFGIDTEELTFGRDPSCSVRLYYPDINLVHCKITFEERKAFLIVLGNTGLFVDGCRVYPNSTPGQPTTIPLSNNSEIEIHNKRFKFSYPPKEIRATLLATPARTNRKLRLSMIHSAQVFSPRPSKDPRENLRVLKSPMKNTFQSPRKPSALSQSPLTSATHDDSDEEVEEEEIVLVDGNHPRVVEEEKDLVILEDVEVPVPPPTIQIQPPKTPQRRRSQSLHRAVLIRSAQRAVLEHERQQRQEEEEREEEMEVLDTIANDDISSDEDRNTTRRDNHNSPPSDEDPDSDEDEVEGGANQERRKSLWRKSFERLWPFRSPEEAKDSKDEEAEQEEQEEISGEEAEDYERNEARDQPETLPSLSQTTPIRRPLGSFMTPQVGQKSGPFDRGESLEPSRGRLAGGPPVRYSMGGEARRMPLESVWRVRDIVVPLKGEDEGTDLSTAATGPDMHGTPRQSDTLGQAQASPVRSRSEVSAEERKAIQQRRRSALREVDSHSYFTGGIPGMSPSKASASPVKSGFSHVDNPFRPASPTKQGAISPVKDIARRLSTDEEDEKLDTRSLLERMKETVECMKRRRSTLGVSDSSPVKPSSDSNPFEDAAPNLHAPALSEGEGDDDKENDKNAMDVGEPFSLLRSPSKNHPPPQIRAPKRNDEQASDSPPVVPLIVEDTIVPEQPQVQELVQPSLETAQLQAPLRRSRTKSRSPQPPAEPAAPRRTRKATAEPEEPVEDSVAVASKRDLRKTNRTPYQEESSVPARATAPARRAPKPAVEPEEHHVTKRGGRKTPTVDEKAEAVAKRTSRKVAVKEEKEEKQAVPVPARRGRVPKAAPATARMQEATDTAKRPTARVRGGKTTPVEPNNGDGDDPLDSLATSEEVTTEEHSPVPAPAKTVAKTRKPRAGMKLEEETTEVLRTSTRPRTTTVNATKTPAPTRGRSRKTPATAPAVTQVEVDKENTPGAQPTAGPSTKPTAGDADEGVVVKVRTTRKTRTATVKQETEEAVAAAQPKPRATRTTRVRTKTT